MSFFHTFTMIALYFSCRFHFNLTIYAFYCTERHVQEPFKIRQHHTQWNETRPKLRHTHAQWTRKLKSILFFVTFFSMMYVMFYILSFYTKRHSFIQLSTPPVGFVGIESSAFIWHIIDKSIYDSRSGEEDNGIDGALQQKEASRNQERHMTSSNWCDATSKKNGIVTMPPSFIVHRSHHSNFKPLSIMQALTKHPWKCDGQQQDVANLN